MYLNRRIWGKRENKYFLLPFDPFVHIIFFNSEEEPGLEFGDSYPIVEAFSHIFSDRPFGYYPTIGILNENFYRRKLYNKGISVDSSVIFMEERHCPLCFFFSKQQETLKGSALRM